MVIIGIYEQLTAHFADYLISFRFSRIIMRMLIFGWNGNLENELRFMDLLFNYRN